MEAKRITTRNSVTKNMPQKVLIVEDEYLIALDMEAALEDAGFISAGIASTRAEVRVKVRQNRPDIALVDLHLADGLTGHLIGEELGKLGARVVFVTANPALVAQGVPHALGVIEKPADEDSLLDVVRWASEASMHTQTSQLPPRFQRFA